MGYLLKYSVKYYNLYNKNTNLATPPKSTIILKKYDTVGHISQKIMSLLIFNLNIYIKKVSIFGKFSQNLYFYYVIWIIFY